MSPGLQQCCPIQMQQSAAVSPAPCLGPVPALRRLHVAPAQACLRRHSCPVPAALIPRHTGHSGPQQPILNVVTLKSIFPASPSLLQNCLQPNSQHRGEGKGCFSLLSKSLPCREVPPSDPPLQLLIEEVGEGRLPTPDQAIGVLPNPYDNCSPGQPRARPCMEAVTASLSFLSSPTHTHTHSTLA